MRFQEKLVNSFESVLLGLAMAWTIGIGIALLAPVGAPHEHNGSVEIYSLAAVNNTRTML
jgi:predicted anti-sigma-YlaC factor YlaD